MNQTYMKEKKIFPLVMSMALPMMLSMAFNSLYNIVDSYFVAKLSEDAMTALSLVYPAQNLLTAVAVGFGVGVNAMISFYLGAQNQEKADKTATQGMVLGVLHGVLLMILFLCGMNWFLGMFTKSDTVRALGMEYSNVVFLFSTIVTGGITLEKIFQAVGRMRATMVSMIAGFVTNIVLDPLLIFGIGPFPRMEIAGAALATGIGQVITLLVYIIYYVLDPLPVKLRRTYLRPEGEICGKTYGIGIPATLNMALPSLLISALNGILALFVAHDECPCLLCLLAAYSGAYVLVLGVYYKLQTFIYLPSNGIIQGIRPLIGYNYGAGERKRVEQIYRLTLELTAGIMAIGTALCWLIPGGLIGLFTENPETVTIGITALHIISLGFILSAVSVTSSGALEALGQGMASLVISVMRYVAVIIPAAFVLSRLIGVTGVWWAFVCTESVTAVVAYVLYHRVWKRA